MLQMQNFGETGTASAPLDPQGMATAPLSGENAAGRYRPVSCPVPSNRAISSRFSTLPLGLIGSASRNS